MQDTQGRQVPLDAIKPIDMERHKLVGEIVDKARALNQSIAQFKADAFGDIAAFVQLSAEQYGAKVGGDKGNVTLVSFDGRYKVQRAISETLAFDERLQAAKALIDECIHEWSEGARKEIRALINDAFQVDSSGKINTGRVLGLRRLDIEHAKWKSAMQAISDAVQVTGSKSYVRVYERIGTTDQYRPIPLDIAAA
jgi:hypothetical protein